MEQNEKLQVIIDYVENHLQQKEELINSKEISKIAECSFSFFQKVFSYMNGISFAEYIRSRKLTLAGYDLKSTDLKVIDISYKYGYASPTSFTKAFQLFHGVSPREARNQNVTLSYEATVTDVTVGNTVSIGNGTNDGTSVYGSDTENLYTGSITLTKYASDADNDNLMDNATLAGAGFKVSTMKDGEIVYATVADGKFTGWVIRKLQLQKLSQALMVR